MVTLIHRLVFGTAKALGALALGGAILGQVLVHSVPTKGIAYVHVMKPWVTVTIDDQTYWVEAIRDTPIVCELCPGSHMLRMLRSENVLFEEEFTLDPGQEVVLTAWERVNDTDPEFGLSRTFDDGKAPASNHLSSLGGGKGRSLYPKSPNVLR
jgi:hypothetical protein